MIHWRYITGDNESASRALASDEFLMGRYSAWASGEYPEPSLRIYTYRSHTALVGRFQNVEAEVNLPECRSLGVEVNRRVTGGGAIIMGDRQLMIALASSSEHPVVPAHPVRILPKMARGVIMGLAELGIHAEFRPKNDIVVNGRKIGGSAMCIEETGAFLYHATVLLDFDIPFMLRVLNIPPEKLSDKAVKSHEERMTSIFRETGKRVTVQEAREAICRGFEQAFKMSAVHVPFTPVELQKISGLEQEKYLTDAWVFQRQPAPDMIGQCVRKTPAGLVRAYVAMAGDTIKSVLFTGDFISDERFIKDVEAALKWGRADRDSIARTIRVVMSGSSQAPQDLGPDELADIVREAVTNAWSAELTPGDAEK